MPASPRLSGQISTCLLFVLLGFERKSCLTRRQNEKVAYSPKSAAFIESHSTPRIIRAS